MNRWQTIFLIILLFVALLLGVVFALRPVAVEVAHAWVTIGKKPLLVEVAGDDASRTRGLAGRETLAENGGMLFTFEGAGMHAIWMKGMRVPLDIFWIRDGLVVDLVEYVALPRAGARDDELPVYRPAGPAEFILEVPAGFAEREGVRIGDTAQVVFPHDIASFAHVSAAGSLSGVPREFSPPPAEDFFIDTMRRRPVSGRDFQVGKMLAANEAYKKYLVSYRIGSFLRGGVMNVPVGKVPAGGFPVLILNHGLIRPEIYFPGRGSGREQNFFARRGYVTIHPDYRGLGISSPNPNPHHDFYAGYTEDVLALLSAVKKAAPPFTDTNRVGMWGHSMGGGIAARVMVLEPAIKAFVLFASISADAEANFFELPKKEVEWVHATYAWGKELNEKISPLPYFSDVSAPVQLHHGTEDFEVPPVFSEEMYATLRRLGKKVEFFKYPQERHEFAGSWQLAAERALQFFDLYVKQAE